MDHDLLIELFGASTGLAYLYGEIRQRPWIWPVGIATSALYVVVFYQSKFYADMATQLYYLCVSFYGMYLWRRGGDGKDGQPLAPTHARPRQAAALAGATAAIFAILALGLARLTDSPQPLGDALTTALGVTATWMLARKIVEHWHVWVVANAISMALYLWRGLYPTAGLYFFYATMSIVGYRQWRAAMRNRQSGNND